MPSRDCEHILSRSTAQRRRPRVAPTQRHFCWLACAALTIVLGAAFQPASAGSSTSAGSKTLSASPASHSTGQGAGAGRAAGAGRSGGASLRGPVGQGGHAKQTFQISIRSPAITSYTPINSFPKPVSPGTHTSISLSRADGALTYQVLVTGGTRSIVPTGWASAPKPLAIALQYLPLPKFAHEGGSGGGETPHATLINVSNNDVHFQSSKSMAGAIGKAQSFAETDTSFSLAAASSQPREVDDLTQFLWYCVFLAGLLFVLGTGVLAVRRATV